MGEEESNEDLFSVAEEWSGIQERLKRVPYQMKLEIKEGLRLLVFPETTMLSPPPRRCQPKEQRKKKSNLHQKRHVGFHPRGETIDSQHLENQSSPPKKSSPRKTKGARICISPCSLIQTPVPVPKPILVPRIMIHQVLCIACQNS